MWWFWKEPIMGVTSRRFDRYALMVFKRNLCSLFILIVSCDETTRDFCIFLAKCWVSCYNYGHFSYLSRVQFNMCNLDSVLTCNLHFRLGNFNFEKGPEARILFEIVHPKISVKILTHSLEQDHLILEFLYFNLFSRMIYRLLYVLSCAMWTSFIISPPYRRATCALSLPPCPPAPLPYFCASVRATTLPGSY